MTDKSEYIELTQEGKARQWEVAIVALLSSSTVATAAERVGVHERTLQRWLRPPEFQVEFRAAKRALIDGTTTRLRSGALSAVRTLESLHKDVRIAPAARVTAARTILEMALRAHEVEELLDRLTALEEGAKQR